MSLAENLLNSLDETAYENSRIAGFEPEEAHIVVGQDRVIIVPNNLKTIAVKGDKDIETVTFDCVRFWDENDLSTFAIYINYILPNGDEGTYIPKNITKLDDIFTFDWEIGSEITYVSGKLTFWIVAKLTDDNETLIKQWSSLQNSDCSIAQGGDRDKSYSPYEDGFEDGRKAEYDAFWDTYQDYGNRKNYNYAFPGPSWVDSIFKPKYPIAPTSPQYMFMNSGITDLTNINLDLSRATTAYYTFSGVSITYIPYLDCSKVIDFQNAFYNSTKLKHIEGLKFGPSVIKQGYARMFGSCNSLETVCFEGIINQDGLDMHWSTKLSKASIESIINALSTTTSGLTVTLSLTAVNNSFETSSGANDGRESEEWKSLIATRSNWTIAYL